MKQELSKNRCKGLCRSCGTGCGQYCEQVHQLQKEIDEQCRLNGMGAQRELKLITERDRYREALEKLLAVPFGRQYKKAVSEAKELLQTPEQRSRL